MAVHLCNPNTQELRKEDAGLHNKTLFKQTNNNKSKVVLVFMGFIWHGLKLENRDTGVKCVVQALHNTSVQRRKAFFLADLGDVWWRCWQVGQDMDGRGGEGVGYSPDKENNKSKATKRNSMN
jgi:hypothetical protein